MVADHQLALDRLELGRHYFKIVDFESALQQLEQGLAEARAKGDGATWCRHLPLLLRIYAERLDFDAINRLKAEVFARQAELPLSSATAYTLGIAASYEGKADMAELHFTQAYALAENPADKLQAQFGLASVAFQRRRLDEAVTQLNVLHSELRTTLLTDLKLAAGLMSVICLREAGKIEQAFTLLKPMQETCRMEQNLFMTVNVLFVHGTLYQALNDVPRARQYFEVTQSLLVPRDLKHTSVQIETRLAQLAAAEEPAKPVLELIDHSHRTVITPAGKQVPVGNQFVLITLLKMLGGMPGAKLSKEEITRKLWKQDYNPLVHDNKIYVTIRRLRKLIEPDSRHPAYVLNAEDGYMFNPKVSFKVQS